MGVNAGHGRGAGGGGSTELAEVGTDGTAPGQPQPWDPCPSTRPETLPPNVLYMMANWLPPWASDVRDCLDGLTDYSRRGVRKVPGGSDESAARASRITRAQRGGHRPSRLCNDPLFHAKGASQTPRPSQLERIEAAWQLSGST